MKESDRAPKISPAGGLLFGGLSPTIAAAHELKAPLSLIRQLALSLDGVDSDSAEAKRLLRQIRLTSERALRLTTDLSRTARLDDSLFACEPISPAQICEDVAHELSPLYREKGREIIVQARQRPPLALGNRHLLRRILLNFADNALHYSEKDSPVILRMSSRTRGKTVRFGVRDYGPAVPIDLWLRLQRNLGKNTQTLHARPQSSGLGLYVAGRFADAMNGKIGATRHRDGSTFYVELGASSQLRLL